MTDPGTSSPDANSDSVEQFLADLRKLRDNQPSLSYEALAGRARKRGYTRSSSAMHNVYRADKLPTRETVSAFVVALADVATAAEFDERWVRLNGGIETTAAGGIDGSAVSPEIGASAVDDARDDAPSPKRTRRAWWWWLAGFLVIVITNIVTCLVTIAVVRPAPVGTAPSAPATVSAFPAEPVRDGMNPNQLPHCLDDVQTVDSATNEAFTVKVNFSERCNATWGKVERIDGRGLGNTIGIRIYRAAAPDDDTTAQRTSERDATSAFTPIIVRTDPTERLCVDGAVTDGTRTVPAPRPVCL